MRPSDSVDPWPWYAACRRAEPVRREPGTAVLGLFRHADIKHVLTSEDFTVAYPFRISKQILGETLLDIDGRAHAVLRRAVMPFFETEHVARLECTVFKTAAREVLDAVADARRIDFVADCASAFPTRVMSVLVGLRTDEVGPLLAMVDYLVEHLDGSKGDFDTASRYRDVLRQRLADDILPRGEGALATFVNGLDASASDAQRIGLLLLILFAGIETSVSTLANTMSCLLLHPAHRRALPRVPGHAAAVLHESMRWEPAQHETVRFCARDTVVGGVAVERGTALRLYLASANRDESVYAHADLFDPSRPEKHNLSFGLGRHYCVGKKFALASLERFISMFFDRYAVEEDSAELAPVSGGMFRRPDHIRMTLAPAIDTARREAAIPSP